MSEKKLIVKVGGQKITLPAKKTEPTKGRPKAVVLESNPFVSARIVQRRVKALFYGATGTRKTRTALKFPKPAVADFEDGTKWYADEFSFDVLPEIPDFATYSAVINWLAQGDHPYLTFVTDPSTIVWELLQKQWSDTFLVRNIGSAGFKFDFYNMQPSDWKHVKAEWKDLMTRLMDLDMHVIFTARMADLFAEGELMKKIGERPDTEKNVRYYFDIVLRFDKNDKGDTVVTPEKDRTGKLPREPFLLDYAIIEQAFGKEYLNREIDKSLMPKIDPPEDEPATVEVTVEEADPTPEEFTSTEPVEIVEDPKVDVTLPKEEGLVCPQCERTVPTLKLHTETNKNVCKECFKELSKPEGSSSKPIKVVIKKVTKGKKKAAEKPIPPVEPAPKEFCTEKQEKDIREYCETLGISENRMMKSLSAYDATSFDTLTKEKAEKILKSLDDKLRAKR